MPFRFRKSVRLFPGVRVNLSKSGMSVSVGGPGATLNLSSPGSALTLGLPGTGLSYRHQLTTRRRPSVQSLPPKLNGSSPQPGQFPDSYPAFDDPRPGEIKSADVAVLTSPDLQGLKQLINEAAHQKAGLQPDLEAAHHSRLRAWRKLRRREQLPLRWFIGSAIPKARGAFEEAEAETIKVLEAIAVSEVSVEFAFDDRARAAHDELVAAHTALARAHRIWDVLSSVAVDRVRERTTANNSVTRTPVQLSRVSDGVIAGTQVGLRFQNANGADLDFFPGFLLVRERGARDYALIDLRDVSLEASSISFIENETVPIDSQVIGHTWFKANKDGSPDRRFNNNYQIPIARYGSLHFETPSGVAETYHASNAELAERFGRAFAEVQRALRALAQKGVPGPVVPSREAVTIDVASRLPALPEVRGAHELTVLAAAVVGMLAFLAYPRRAPETPPPLTVAQRSIEPAQASAFAPSPTLAPKDAPVASGAPAAAPLRQPQVVLPSTPARQERMTLKQNANLREGPSGNAAAIRVVPIATIVFVFARNGNWVQIGDTSPWGWMHTSVLGPASEARTN